MKTKIAKWGNSIAVRIPRALADEMGLAPGQVLDFKRAGTRIEIETQPGAVKIPRYRLEDLVAEMKRLGPENQPPLVDWGPDVGAEIIDDEYSRGEITLDDLLADKTEKNDSRGR